MIRFSIVLAIHNQEKTLADALSALLAMKIPRESFEIIAVDNNSEDGSMAILRRTPMIRILSEPKPGAYAARNTGLQAARGEILAFTDPDCLVSPDWLRVINDGLCDPSVQVLLGCRRSARESAGLALLADYENQKDAVVLSSPDPLKYYGYTNNMAARRSIFGKVGVFPELDRGGDTIFVRRVVDLCGCAAVRYEPNMLVRHLEIDSVKTHLRKIFIYGHSFQRNKSVVESSPVDFRQRWQIYRNTVAHEKLGPVKAFLLLVLLACGMGCWWFGRFAATIAKKNSAT